MKISDSTRKLAGLIADEIVRRGHAQDSQEIAYTDNGKCCVVAGHDYCATNDLCKAFLDATGAVVTDAFGGRLGVSSQVIEFNDAMTTDDVLDALRAIEVG